jgi:hypothetical protein
MEAGLPWASHARRLAAATRRRSSALVAGETLLILYRPRLRSEVSRSARQSACPLPARIRRYCCGLNSFCRRAVCPASAGTSSALPTTITERSGRTGQPGSLLRRLMSSAAWIDGWGDLCHLNRCRARAAVRGTSRKSSLRRTSVITATTYSDTFVLAGQGRLAAARYPLRGWPVESPP